MTKENKKVLNLISKALHVLLIAISHQSVKTIVFDKDEQITFKRLKEGIKISSAQLAVLCSLTIKAERNN